MRPQKWFVPFGMLSVVFFFTHTILGNILWKEYNPIRQSISELTADGAPNAQLLRWFTGAYEVCFLIFALSMVYMAFCNHNSYINAGYSLLLITALISIVGFNTFPMTVIFIISLRNLAHIIVTIILLCTMIFSITLVSIGCLKTESLKALGRILLFTAIIPALFNPVFWYAGIHGYDNTGLLERITIYPFHAFTFAVSWRYTKPFIIDRTRAAKRSLLKN